MNVHQTVREFEEAVWRVEGIRIVVRADPNDKVILYYYERAAPKNFTVQKWIDGRVDAKVGGREVVVIDGTGHIPPGHTHLETVWSSYS